MKLMKIAFCWKCHLNWLHLFRYINLVYLTYIKQHLKMILYWLESRARTSLRKCAYIRPISKPGDVKTIFDFSIFFFIFFNRLNITWSGRQKYGLIGNFKSFKKMSLHQTDIQTRRRKKKSIFPYFYYYYFF